MLHRRRPRFALLVLLALVAAVPAAADLNHFIRITGATQNQFPGGSDIAPWENYTIGFAYHHLIERPASGGPVTHETVISTFAMDDPAVPYLLRALQADESLQVVFNFTRPTSGGAEQQYARITLTGARVTSIEPLSPDDQNSDLLSYKATVRARFSYTSIEFENLPANDSVSLNN